MAHLFVADLDDPVIADGDRHHVERVLRIRPGEAVSVSDGQGGRRDCIFVAGGGLEAVAAITYDPPPEPVLSIGFALVKGERPEWIVQKLTECGVDRIVPFVAERSVVRWDDERAERNRERFARVAREAAMQSRRSTLPQVSPIRPFAAVAAEAAEAGGVAWARADAGGAPPSLERPALLIGPEGGWSDAERGAVGETVALGGQILRAETAAVAAGVLLGALRAGLVVPPA